MKWSAEVKEVGQSLQLQCRARYPFTFLMRWFSVSATYTVSPFMNIPWGELNCASDKSPSRLPLSGPAITKKKRKEMKQVSVYQPDCSNISCINVGVESVRWNTSYPLHSTGLVQYWTPPVPCCVLYLQWPGSCFWDPLPLFQGMTGRKVVRSPWRAFFSQHGLWANPAVHNAWEHQRWTGRGVLDVLHPPARTAGFPGAPESPGWANRTLPTRAITERRCRSPLGEWSRISARHCKCSAKPSHWET